MDETQPDVFGTMSIWQGYSEHLKVTYYLNCLGIRING